MSTFSDSLLLSPSQRRVLEALTLCLDGSAELDALLQKNFSQRLAVISHDTSFPGQLAAVVRLWGSRESLRKLIAAALQRAPDSLPLNVVARELEAGGPAGDAGPARAAGDAQPVSPVGAARSHVPWLLLVEQELDAWAEEFAKGKAAAANRIDREADAATAGAVGTGAVGTGAVGTGAVGTGAVGTGAVGTGAVGTGAVGTGAVGTGAVGTGAVGTGETTLAERLGHLKAALCGYTAYAQREKRVYDGRVIHAAVAYLRLLGEARKRSECEVCADTYRLLNAFTIWQRDAIGFGLHDLYPHLRTLCAEADKVFRNDPGYSETVWFGRLFWATERGGIRDAEAIKELAAALKKTHKKIGKSPLGNDPLQRLEWHAFYLERFARISDDGDAFLAFAAAESMEAAQRAAGRGEAAFDEAFAAALWARAGHCLERSQPALAATCYGRAAAALTGGSGASELAGEYYARAVQLASGAAPPDRKPEWIKDLARQQEAHRRRMAALDAGDCPPVAVIGNEYDRVFVDLLFAPLRARGLRACYHDSNRSPEYDFDLLRRNFTGILIVGGVRAPFTDMLLQHLAGARERLAARREFDRIEYEPPQGYQAAFVLNGAGERPIQVLAGGTRYDTCRAVVAFLQPGAIGIDEFARLARRAGEGGGDAPR